MAKTFNPQDPAVIRRILDAASPQNFDYKEVYYLANLQTSFVITESIRTLTILSISAHRADLYTMLFKGWRVAEASPLAFFHKKNDSIVIFRPDWTIQLHSNNQEDKILSVSKSDVFEQLKTYLR